MILRSERPICLADGSRDQMVVPGDDLEGNAQILEVADGLDNARLWAGRRGPEIPKRSFPFPGLW